MTIQTKLANPANYGGTRSMSVVDYIVVHYTGNRGDTAQNNAVYFAREAVKTSAHLFVDESSVWQSVPYSRIAYHCDAKKYRHKYCRNSNSIGVEVCMLDKRGGIRYDSIAHAAEVVRMLMHQYDIPASHVLRHYDVTGKDCPAPMVADPSLWEDFKRDLEVRDLTEREVRAIIRAERESYMLDLAQAPAHDYARQAIADMMQLGITDGQRPQATMTREECVTMLHRLMQHMMQKP